MLRLTVNRLKSNIDAHLQVLRFTKYIRIDSASGYPSLKTSWKPKSHNKADSHDVLHGPLSKSESQTGHWNFGRFVGESKLQDSGRGIQNELIHLTFGLGGEHTNVGLDDHLAFKNQLHSCLQHARPSSHRPETKSQVRNSLIQDYQIILD